MSTNMLVFPPYQPEDHRTHQDTDRGCFDVAFDADVRAQTHAMKEISVEFFMCQGDKGLSLSDDSKQRNYAWLGWWRAVWRVGKILSSAEIQRYAPLERPGHAAHARYIRSCTTRLLKAAEAIEELYDYQR